MGGWVGGVMGLRRLVDNKERERSQYTHSLLIHEEETTVFSTS